MTRVQKYRNLWNTPSFRLTQNRGTMHLCDGLAYFDQHDNPKTLLDLGCGLGEAGEAFKYLGYTVSLVDFVESENYSVPFLEQDLRLLTKRGQFGYCVNVLQHFDPHEIHTVLKRIAMKTRVQYFVIDLRQLFIHDFPDVPEMPGGMIHMCVREPEWWLEKINTHFTVVEATFDEKYLKVGSVS